MVIGEKLKGENRSVHPREDGFVVRIIARNHLDKFFLLLLQESFL